MERKEYRSALRSRRLIREAFAALLKEKPFERITVTDIVNRADINRSTFYAHYQDIRALVEEIQGEALDFAMQAAQQLSYRELFRDPMPFLQVVSQLLLQNRSLYRQMMNSDYARSQMDSIKVILLHEALTSAQVPQAVRSSQGYRIRVGYFIGGIIELYLQWLTGQLDCTLDEINRQVAGLIRASAPQQLLGE